MSAGRPSPTGRSARLLPALRGASIIAALAVLVLAVQGCRPAATGPTLTPAVRQPGQTAAASAAPTATQPGGAAPGATHAAPSATAGPVQPPTPTGAAPSATATLEPSPIPSQTPTTIPLDPDLLRQGAASSSLEPYQLDAIAAGDYQPGLPDCGGDFLAGLPAESGEIVLKLSYAASLQAQQIEIYTGGGPHGIRRVELLNESSGLGRTIYQGGASIRREALPTGACKERLVLPADIDFEVDTVFIAFENLDAVAQVAAVEMLGRLQDFVDLPVSWRVPLPGTPVDITAGQGGLVYVATEPDGLYMFDVEGNRLEQFSTPDGADLAGAAAGPSGSLVVTDYAHGRFIVYTADGEQVTSGGDDVFYRAAVSPKDGSLFLLGDDAIFVFDPATTDLLRQMPFDDEHSYLDLAFDPQGRLFALGDYDWSANLAELDPLTGEVLDDIPLDRSGQGEAAARELAIDSRGNFYILFAENDSQIAVHVLDPDGDFVRRFGRLAAQAGSWPEGTFLDPRAISISPDGRYIFIADGQDGGAAFLTAFQVGKE